MLIVVGGPVVRVTGFAGSIRMLPVAHPSVSMPRHWSKYKRHCRS